MKIDIQKLIGNRLTVIVVLGLAIYIGANTVGVIARNWQLQQEIATLREEIALLTVENERLTYDIEYYKTDEYLEQAARQKLNLKAAGENVTIVGDINQPDGTRTDFVELPTDEEKSNWQAWWDFLLARD